jgi:hypothetical protein
LDWPTDPAVRAANETKEDSHDNPND